MSYLGSQRPIIKYGTSYGTTWNLQTDDVSVNYAPRFEIERDFYEAISGKIYVVSRDDDISKLRFYCDLIFFNLTDAQVEKFIAIQAGLTVKITIHADAPNTGQEIECIITSATDPVEDETGTQEAINYTATLSLKSIDRIDHPDDTVT